MNTMEKNMAAFRDYRGMFYQPLMEQKDMLQEESGIEEVQLIESRDGNSVLSVQKEGNIIRLNSMYRPLAEAEKWCGQYAFQNLNMNILMFGMGNAIFVRKMLENITGDTRLFLYEPDMKIFYSVLEQIDISDIIKNKSIKFYLKGINEREFFQDLRMVTHWSNLPTQVDCCHPGYDKLLPEDYNSFRSWIEQCDVTEIVNRNTGVYFARSSALNMIRNLSYIIDSNYITEYIGKLPIQSPAIIVAAGPSLDNNIEELKRAEGKAFIIATDTAVRRLIEHQVHFDCMVTVDARKPSSYMNLPECKDVPLFCCLEANHEILNYHQGKKIWFIDSGYNGLLYKKYKKHFITCGFGGSVATTAFGISRLLGFKRIALIGQDLAYKGEHTHAGGEVSTVLRESMSVTTVEGIDGKPVKTRGDWKNYLSWFKREIENVIDSVEVIDATEGGALIPGTKLMPLHEVIDKYCDSPADSTSVLDGMKPTFSGADREAIRKDLLHVEKEFRNIQYKSEQAQEIVERALPLLEEEKKPEKIDKEMRELSKATKFVGKQLAYAIIDQYIENKAVEFIQDINVMSGDTFQDRKKTLESAYQLYKVCTVAVDEVASEVEQSMEKIRRV